MSLEWKNVEIMTLSQTEIDFQLFLLPKLVPAFSKFSQIRGSLRVIPSWKNITFEHEAWWRLTVCDLGGGLSLIGLSHLGGGLRILPVKAASVFIEENLRVISCLWLWMSRCSSDWKRCRKKKKRYNSHYKLAKWQFYSTDPDYKHTLCV